MQSIVNAPANINIAAHVSALTGNITHLYGILSDTISGPKVVLVAHRNGNHLNQMTIAVSASSQIPTSLLRDMDRSTDDVF